MNKKAIIEALLATIPDAHRPVVDAILAVERTSDGPKEKPDFEVELCVKRNPTQLKDSTILYMTLGEDEGKMRTYESRVSEQFARAMLDAGVARKLGAI